MSTKTLWLYFLLLLLPYTRFGTTGIHIFWGRSTLWFCLMDLNLDLCSIDVIIIKITKMLQDEYFNISVLTKDLCEQVCDLGQFREISEVKNRLKCQHHDINFIKMTSRYILCIPRQFYIIEMLTNFGKSIIWLFLTFKSIQNFRLTHTEVQLTTSNS